MYNIEKSIENRAIENVINSRFLKISMIFLGIILSLVAANILGLWEKINPLLASSVLLTGSLVIFFFISKCIDNKIIPYFLLQYINIWIFLNQDLFSPFGLSFKPHVLVFGISILITFYYMCTNFKYLWSKIEFKLLLFFFILNMFYAFFYSSDFRSSNYIDAWIQNNIGLNYASIASGYGAATREFGSEETKFLKYIAGIIPLISFVIAYMSFYGLKTIEETKKKFEDIIKLFSVGYISYIFVVIFCILIGTTSVMFMENRLAINTGFTGSDFEGLLLLLFIGFNLYISNFKYVISAGWVKYVINVNIIVLALLILLGIKKGTILSFLAGFAIIQVGAFFFKEKTQSKPKTQVQKNTAILLFVVLLPMIVILPFIFLNQDYVGDMIYNISNRFSGTETLDIREINWHFYLKNWADTITWFTAIFGFGTDASRETSFFLSAMQPDRSFQQPHIHNMYLEYFYNWGIMAFLYFLPPLIILFKNISDLMKKSVNNAVKLFSSISTACIVFFFVYYFAESPAIPANIMFFALIGFLESLKIAFMQFKGNEVNGDYNRSF